jgi:hypothetical protein
VVARNAFRLTFGLLAVAMGCGLILWVCYNEFIRRLPQYSGTHWWEPLGAGPVMVGIGVYGLRSSRSLRKVNKDLTKGLPPTQDFVFGTQARDS